ncbi:MAG: hypothetical protein UY29_C0006G0058 [Parcubacteria group bacterium GW2011_GWC2_48_17]|nr:MAG: hypothetical protein UY29_C0006G0058 [Parcubacteria group bacterium GW2011_GWC2_48_17]
MFFVSYVFIKPYQNLFSKQIVGTFRRACKARGRKCATSSERLKWEEMSRSRKMDSVLRNYFAGGRIRKTETNVFEIRQGLGFRPAGGRGRNVGRILFGKGWED